MEVPSAPARAPHACGALGRFDRARVQRMARLLGIASQPAHEDDRSVLLLDRPPVAWSGGSQRGLGWVEGDARGPGTDFADWRGAAGAGICGLVLDGRRRWLHSAANGLAPLYWLEQGGAVYFASRIDPLARTSEALLSIDWDAWAAIVAMRYPLGNRTPFAEISRLPQSATLRRRLGGSRLREERWAWVEVETENSLAAAAEGVAAALEEALAPLPGGIVAPLSGGRDSRMLFMPLARDGKVAVAATLSDDEGDTYEEDLAEPVTEAFGVPHERLRGAEGDYEADWEERARRVEYEFADHAWMVPLSRRVAGHPAPVPDGLGIDTLLSVGRHFFTPEALDTSDPRAAMAALFETLRRYGHGELALEESLQAPLAARAREQYLSEARRFDGHPKQAVFAQYTTRTRRGVSSYATKLLGDRSQAMTPGVTDRFVSAALTARMEEKLDSALFLEIYAILAPEIAALPSTAATPRRPPHLPRRWCSATALGFHRRSLLDGPLAPHLSPQLRAWIDGPVEAEPDANLRLGIETVGLLHAWWRRYRDLLRAVDPTELRG